MGNFYLNYTIRTTDAEAVTRLLEGHDAIVASTPNDHVVVYSNLLGDVQDPTLVADELSRELETAVLVVMNHDDDILKHLLYEDGECLDDYNSIPNYWDESASEYSPPEGGDAEALCRAFGGTDVAAVETALRRPHARGDETGDEYVFAVDRHDDLAKLLNLPEWSVGVSYNDVVEEDIQEVYPAVTFTPLS